MNSKFSPREFLRQRQALLVHFSTPMSSQPLLVFPNDILQAMSLRDTMLAFSTIQIGDENPQKSGGTGAEGSVGMVVDIGSETIVERVHPSDAGSSPVGSVGSPPTERGCADSIDKRITSNEWCVRNYVPIGMFILPPIWVSTLVEFEGQKTRTEREITLPEAVGPFHEQRVFGADNSSFFEFDRPGGRWKRIRYDEIIPI